MRPVFDPDFVIFMGASGLLESRAAETGSSFGLLTRLCSPSCRIDDRVKLVLDEIELAPGFVREVVEVWEAWEGKDSAPLKLQQLLLNLRIDVHRLYKIGVRPQEKLKIPVYNDTRLG